MGIESIEVTTTDVTPEILNRLDLVKESLVKVEGDVTKTQEDIAQIKEDVAQIKEDVSIKS